MRLQKLILAMALAGFFLSGMSLEIEPRPVTWEMLGMIQFKEEYDENSGDLLRQAGLFAYAQKPGRSGNQNHGLRDPHGCGAQLLRGEQIPF